MATTNNYSRRDIIGSLAVAAVTTGIIDSAVEAQAVASMRIAAGRTQPGYTNWVQGSSSSEIYVNVDTSQGKFVSIPIYVSSLGGLGNMFSTSGSSCIYAPTNIGFTVYLKSLNGSALIPSVIKAAPYGWFVNWHGIEA
jgi:hypothetical protein